MRKPIVMLTNTSQYWEVTGTPVRADGWFGNSDGIHTVSIHFTDFIGGFKLQGSLMTEPTENDWFDINMHPYTATVTGPEIRYPQDPNAPTGTTGGDTGSDAFTFVGNFTYLRAVVVRDYLGSAPTSNEQILSLHVGSIDKVLLGL